MFYLIVILLSDVLIIFGNGLWSDARWGQSALMTAAYTVGVIALDGLLAWIIRWTFLPERWFTPEVRLFHTPGKERKLYRTLKIRQWKHLVPEFGGFTGFHKDKLQSAKDADYLCRFITENNYGTVIHLANAVFGFALLALPFGSRLGIALPVALVNMILSLMPYMILRYNTPTLCRLYRDAKRKEEASREQIPENPS